MQCMHHVVHASCSACIVQCMWRERYGTSMRWLVSWVHRSCGQRFESLLRYSSNTSSSACSLEQEYSLHTTHLQQRIQRRQASRGKYVRQTRRRVKDDG